jgi:hypothetical protein
MKIKLLKKAGYKEAMLGLSLSFGTTIEKAEDVAETLKYKDGGHNKFLESIYIWLDITAPRYWWQEADTYRISTKQSESTMHTLHKRLLSQDDFEYPIYLMTLNRLNGLLTIYQQDKSIENLVALKNELPEGFLQRRIWVMNLKTARNIIVQRRKHKLPQWQEFVDFLTLIFMNEPEESDKVQILENVIREVIEENLHLADGDIYTLAKLKQAINYDEEEE